MIENITPIINTGLLFIVVLVISVLYINFRDKYKENEFKQEQKLIQTYLKSNPHKPCVWVYLTNEGNTRLWPSFGSRYTHKLNLPYLNLTLQSIQRACYSSGYKLCIIHDDTLKYILPDWNIDMNFVPKPQRSRVRLYAQFQILYYYGGLWVPSTMLCLSNNLYWLYNSTIHNIRIGTNIDRTLNSSTLYTTFKPSFNVMAVSQTHHPLIKSFMDDMQIIISKDQSSNPNLLDTLYQKCYNLMLEPEVLGYYTSIKTIISLDDLMGTNSFEFHSSTQCCIIPKEELLTYTHYGWFNKMSVEQIRNSSIALSNYI